MMLTADISNSLCGCLLRACCTQPLRRRGRDAEQSAVLPGTMAFLYTISCRQDSSLHDLLGVPKSRFKQLLIKGGATTKPQD